VVRLSKYSSGYGNIIIIRHPNGIETAYAHLSKRKVDSGDVVKAGDVIAISGSSGRSTGPHLHFETLYCGHTFDPELIINFEKGTLVQSALMLRRDFLE
jgi:murein DD-endopeptidase MepM/ murein hydrolase activator NlpD